VNAKSIRKTPKDPRIPILSSNDVLAASNRITNADDGINYAGSSTGEYMDNLTSNVFWLFIGGTSGGAPITDNDH